MRSFFWNICNYFQQTIMTKEPQANITTELDDDTYISQIMSRVLTQNSNCIDIGCHSGSILSQMLSLSPFGIHYAFEPIPDLANKLKENFPNVQVYAMALSDIDGEATFHHVITNPGYSGLKQRTYDTPNEQIKTITVKTARLDDVLPPDLKVDFIKIDVEGAEMQVLKGAIRTLKVYKPYVIFEHGQGAANHYGTTPEMIYGFLVNECGFNIFKLNGSNPLSQAQFVSIYNSGSAWNFFAQHGC